MKFRILRFLIGTTLLLSLGCKSDLEGVTSYSKPIILDGEFSDWIDVPPVYEEPAGDNSAASTELKRLWVCNDTDALYVRIQLDRETILQNAIGEAAGNDLRLYMDTDNSIETGYRFETAGYDMEVHFGSKKMIYHAGSVPLQLTLNEAGIMASPSHSSNEFEIRIPFNIRPWLGSPVRAITGSVVQLLMENGRGGARIPEAGSVAYRIAAEPLEKMEPIALNRKNRSDFRVLSFNVHRNELEKNSDPFGRVIKALRPDIVNLQEVRDGKFVVEWLKTLFPSETEVEWYWAQNHDCLTASRFRVLAEAPIGGNLVLKLDLPDEVSGRDLVLFNAHTACCGYNDSRDREHDQIASTWRDLLDGKGPFPVDPDVSLLMLGDFNMVGFNRQLISLRDGDIYDNETWGPDFSPGRRSGSLGDVPALHTHSRFRYTWRNDRDVYAPGKLDFIFYSTDTMSLRNNFAIWTPDMPEDVLLRHGLERDDSLASDHLALVADFVFSEFPIEPPDVNVSDVGE